MEFEYEEQFDEYLDELLGDVTIGLLSYQPSRVLKLVDPIAYRIEYSEWVSEFVEVAK